MVSDRDPARKHGPGHDRPRPLQREAPIDSEPKSSISTLTLECLRGRKQEGAQGLDPFTCCTRYRDQRNPCEAGCRNDPIDVCNHLGATLRRNEIRFGDRDHALGDAEQIDNREVLQRLRHDTVIRGYHEQREIDPGRSGQHIVKELLVSWHVDKAEHGAIRRRQIGKSEVDGDAARFLFLEAIGVDASQRAHKRRLAVVDVPRSADDHGTPSDKGVDARRSASARSSTDSASRAGARNEPASALPPAFARNNQMTAETPSRLTPAPRKYAAPSMAWPSASPRSAAFNHHAAAAPGSRSTPSALW